jgi:hypothetical protein
MILKPLRSPKASVLVLEEDPFLRAGLCSILTAADYELAEAAEGANPGAGIDLVLAGVDAQTALQRLDCAAPVILLVDHAAWSGLEFLDAANDLRAVAVLQRPFSRAALLGLMSQALSQPERDALPADPAELPSLAELIVSLDNPNLA